MPGAEDVEQLFRQFDTDVHGWILRIVRDRAAADDVLVEAFWRLSLIPALLVPSGIFLARTTELFSIQMWYALPTIPVGMAMYYLVWKFLVGSLNAEVGIA